MPIEDFSVFTPDRSYARFQTNGYGDLYPGSSSLAIESCRQAMQSAGWTIAYGLYAVATLDFPLGMPTGPGPISGIVALACVWLDVAYWFIGTGQTPPPSVTIGDVTYPVVGVPVAGGGPGSAAALCAALSSPQWTATFVFTAPENYLITLTATAPGALWNDKPMLGSGNTSTGSASVGGGWVMNSNTEFFLNGQLAGNTASFQVTLVLQPDTTGYFLVIVQPQLVPTSSANPYYYNLAIGEWLCIADDYSVVFVCLTPHGEPDLWDGNNTLWLCAPCLLPTGCLSNGSLTWPYAAFIASGPNLGGDNYASSWCGYNSMSPSPTIYAAIDCGFAQTGVSLQTFRYPYEYGDHSTVAGPLMTEAAVSLLSPAIVGFPGPTGTPGWVGLIANAFIDSWYSAPYAMVSEDVPIANIYRAILPPDPSTNPSNTVHTLWLLSSEPDASGQGSNGASGTGGAGGNGAGGGTGTNAPDNNVTAAPNPVNLAAQINQTDYQDVTVSSSSNTPISIAISLSGLPSVQVTDISAPTVSAGASVTITLKLDATGLTAGLSTGTLTISPSSTAAIAIAVNAYVFQGTAASGGSGLSGLCNTSGTQVTWVSGDLFTSGMVGLPFLINGQAFIVATFNSSKEIFTATSGPSQTNAYWNT